MSHVRNTRFLAVFAAVLGLAAAFWAASAQAKTAVTSMSRQAGSVKAKPSLTFRNDTTDELKFAAYDKGDKTLRTPLKTWTIKRGTTVAWSGAPDHFNLKVFKSGATNQLLATKMNVPDRMNVSVVKKGNTYSVSIATTPVQKPIAVAHKSAPNRVPLKRR